MAARFWVTGGTGNWNSTTNWSATSGGASGASVPSTADTATYDASSGAGTATLDISPTIQKLTMTGFTGTLAFGTNTITLNGTGTIFTGSTTMTVTGTPLIICTETTPTATARTIAPQAVTEANSISFNITGSTSNFAISTNDAVRNLDFTGYAGAFQNNSCIIYGNFTASSSVGFSRVAGTGTLTFGATSGTKTINTAGVTFDCPFTFNGVGGTFQLTSALTSGTGRIATLTNGTLDLNNNTLTTGLFTTNASNATTLAFGTGNITLSGTGTIFTGSTTCTVTGTPQVICTDTTTTSRTISPGVVTEANSISFRVSAGGTAGVGNFVITSTHVVRDLDFTDGTNPTGFAGAFGSNTNTVYGSFKASTGMSASAGATSITFAATSGTKTINTAGVTFDRPFTFNGIGGTFQLTSALTSGSTRTCTLTNGTLDLNGFTLTTGLFSSSNSNTRTIAFGTGNITVTATTGTVFSTNTATGFSYTGTSRIQLSASAGAGRSVSGGTNATGTEANSLNFYVTTGSDTVTFNGARRYLGLDTTGFTGTLDISSLVIYGDFKMGAGSATTGTSDNFLSGTLGTQNITSNGVTLNFGLNCNGTGSYVLQDALTLSTASSLTLTSGTLNLNGKTLTVGTAFTTATGTKDLTFNGGTLVCPAVTTTAFNNAVPTGFTTTAGTGTGTISMTGATAKTFVGGGSTFNCTLQNAGADALTVSGSNTFIGISNSVQPTSFVFTSGTTTAVTTWNVNGTSGNLVTIGSTSTTYSTLSKSSGTASSDYLSISNSVATGGALWLAGNNSIDNGGNAGWIFNSNAQNTNGMFLLF